MARAAGAQIRAHRVGGFVLRDEGIDFSSADLIHHGDQIAEAESVDREAEFGLCRHLVALGDGDEAHIVTEARDLDMLRFLPGGGCPRPASDRPYHCQVAPMPDDNFPPQAQATHHEAEFAVAVRGLVEIHEIHVDLGPGDIAIVLGVEVEERLLQRCQPGDPVFRGREGVHPGDDAGAIRACICFAAGAVDFFRGGEDGFVDDLQRDLGEAIEVGGDFPGMLANLFDGFGTIEMLAAGQEPDFVVAQCHFSFP